MPHYPAPNVLNYTFGANEILVGAGLGTTLGNVVSATVTFEAEDYERFSAIFGRAVADPQLLGIYNIRINATFDEPNRDNLVRFLLADTSYRVGMAPAKIDRVQFKGIPVVGNAFTWDIPRVSMRPSGEFGYSDSDWATFSLDMSVLYNAATPANPYGVLTHTGVA